MVVSRGGGRNIKMWTEQESSDSKTATDKNSDELTDYKPYK